ncbi:MAG: hypothetical protein IT529_09130 [Burkholderiales bacterium]|nr:hypothetical protein [Burkholderiales bacterium]
MEPFVDVNAKRGPKNVAAQTLNAVSKWGYVGPAHCLPLGAQSFVEQLGGLRPSLQPRHGILGFERHALCFSQCLSKSLVSDEVELCPQAD